MTWAAAAARPVVTSPPSASAEEEEGWARLACFTDFWAIGSHSEREKSNVHVRMRAAGMEGLDRPPLRKAKCGMPGWVCLVGSWFTSGGVEIPVMIVRIGRRVPMGRRKVLVRMVVGTRMVFCSLLVVCVGFVEVGLTFSSGYSNVGKCTVV